MCPLRPSCRAALRLLDVRIAILITFVVLSPAAAGAQPPRFGARRFREDTWKGGCRAATRSGGCCPTLNWPALKPKTPGASFFLF